MANVLLVLSMEQTSFHGKRLVSIEYGTDYIVFMVNVLLVLSMVVDVMVWSGRRNARGSRVRQRGDQSRFQGYNNQYLFRSRQFFSTLQMQ